MKPVPALLAISSACAAIAAAGWFAAPLLTPASGICAQNLARIASALTLYESNNDGYIPPYATETWANPKSVGDGRQALARALAVSPATWKCPSAVDAGYISDYGTTVSPSFSYETGLELLRLNRQDP